MHQPLTVALEAQYDCTQELLAWAVAARATLARFRLVATGTTGQLLREALDLPVAQMWTGPDGGDRRLGAGISDGRVDMLIFFWDPLTEQPQETDARALLRTAVLSDIPTACTPAAADHLMSSHHLLFPTAPGIR